jgi:hypothetical protein
VIFLFLFTPLFLFGAPQAVYLTWGSSPESSMTVHWLSSINEKEESLTLFHEGKCFSFQATSVILPTDTTYLVHKATLSHLKSDTVYQFKLKGETLYKFKTMPKTLENPITFVVGGDCYHDSLDLLNQMHKLAAKKNPHFALIGGDIAYASSVFSFMPENTKRWIEWIEAYSKTMIREDGTLIPLIGAIGNHDVNGRYSQTPEMAKTFYTLFSTMPGPQGYAVLDFSDYMSLFVLDSGHTHPIEGVQTKWLEEALSKRGDRKYKFALYHVPAYPSCRKMSTLMSPEIREHFVPLFEKYQLTAAFEHHDHGYKRTFPLKEGKRVTSKGVVYIGDGGFGVESPRMARPQEEIPLIEKTASKTHFIFATLRDKGLEVEAIDKEGAVFDQFFIE